MCWTSLFPVLDQQESEASLSLRMPAPSQTSGSKQLLCVGPQMTHGMSWGGSLYGEELIGDVSVVFCLGTADGRSGAGGGEAWLGLETQEDSLHL